MGTIGILDRLGCKLGTAGGTILGNMSDVGTEGAPRVGKGLGRDLGDTESGRPTLDEELGTELEDRASTGTEAESSSVTVSTIGRVSGSRIRGQERRHW